MSSPSWFQLSKEDYRKEYGRLKASEAFNLTARRLLEKGYQVDDQLDVTISYAKNRLKDIYKELERLHSHNKGAKRKRGTGLSLQDRQRLGIDKKLDIVLSLIARLDQLTPSNVCEQLYKSSSEEMYSYVHDRPLFRIYHKRVAGELKQVVYFYPTSDGDIAARTNEHDKALYQAEVLKIFDLLTAKTPFEQYNSSYDSKFILLDDLLAPYKKKESQQLDKYFKRVDLTPYRNLPKLMPIASTQKRNIVMRFLSMVLPSAFNKYTRHFVLYSSNDEYAVLTNSTWRFYASNVEKAAREDFLEKDKQFIHENQGTQTLDQHCGVYTMVNTINAAESLIRNFQEDHEKNKTYPDKIKNKDLHKEFKGVVRILKTGGQTANNVMGWSTFRFLKHHQKKFIASILAASLGAGFAMFALLGVLLFTGGFAAYPFTVFLAGLAAWKGVTLIAGSAVLGAAVTTGIPIGLGFVGSLLSAIKKCLTCQGRDKGASDASALHQEDQDDDEGFLPLTEMSLGEEPGPGSEAFSLESEPEPERKKDDPPSSLNDRAFWIPRDPFVTEIEDRPASAPPSMGHRREGSSG